MAEKQCNRCGHVNPIEANFCSACGASEFTEGLLEPQVAVPQARGVYDTNAVALSVTRLVVLSVVTSGVYILYWLYLTWRQLQSETKGVHYPVWHALTFFVPIYQLFRIHRHIRVVQELALTAGVDTSLTPGLAVVLMALYGLLIVISGSVQSWGTFMILSLIRLALITTVIVWTQLPLNRYWSSIKGEALVKVPFRRGELRFVLLVLCIQLILYLSV